MRDDHTLEPENGAATPADRSPETTSTERPTGARRLQERLVFRTSQMSNTTRNRLNRTADSIKANPYAERAAGMWTASRDRMTAMPAYDKMRSVLGERGPARIAIAGGMLAAVGVATAGGVAAATQNHTDDTRSTTAAVAAVESAKKAEISQFPTAPPTSGGHGEERGHGGGGSKGADKPTPSVERPKAEHKAEKRAEQKAAKKADSAKSVRPVQPKPVMGLSQTQMNNALQIVKAAEKRGMGERGAVIAVATAMQESQLLNLASTAVPESENYHHEGSGSDHDSVGLFQQRSTSGWGAVKDLMTPSYSAGAFLDALEQVPNWKNMPLSAAAQTVQVSAFPDAYAQHEYRATAVVDALMQ
ncbi:hypothetical protein Ais01nite_44590 [Asanoa ishikariensis]|uniref:Uncharacterized protein n=1 Tax=Asanoa ishikariensis TaxID=137265 RepID=A0A1H3S7K8_9ACTN|nr:hypothetical protein [Asanoa ishikariensis]GIF66424.1 hypothetical protein Ais01nite_44590 [Asanoa ishikariensis]SDZ33575.1 hypothetical protein SAMN05421684_4624 [Asanoa ishikariensis]